VSLMTIQTRKNFFVLAMLLALPLVVNAQATTDTAFSIDKIQRACTGTSTYNYQISAETNTQTNQITYTWDLPNSKNDGVYPFCNNYSFVQIGISSRNLTTGINYELVIDANTTNTITIDCSCGISSGDLILYDIAIEYSTDAITPFSGNENWTRTIRVP